MHLQKSIWLALVTVVVLTACGSSPTQAPNKPFVVGAVLTLTGAYAASGTNYITGYGAAIKAINQSGGVLGHQLTFVTRDSQSVPAKGVLAAQDLLANVQPDFMIPDTYSAIVGAVLPITTTAKQLTISNGSQSMLNNPTLFPYHFQAYPASSFQGPAFVAAAQQVGGPSVKVGLLYGTDGASVALVPAEQAAAKTDGIQITGTQSFTPGPPDLTVQVSKLRDSGATLILMHSVGGVEIPTVMKAVRDIGWTDVKVVVDAPSPANNPLMNAVPADVASQFYGVAAAFTARSASGAPSSSNLTALVQELKGQSLDNLSGYVICWDIMHLWAWAVDKAGSVQSDKVKAALETLASTPNVKVPGLIQVSNPRYSPTQHGWGTADMSHYYAIIRVSPLINGTYEGTPLVLPAV